MPPSTTQAPAPFVRDVTTNDALSASAFGGVTVSVVDIDPPLYDAVMRTVCAAPTDAVSMRNDALREPPGIITVAGTLTMSVLSLDSETMTPPPGAFDGMVTVPCGCV